MANTKILVPVINVPIADFVLTPKACAILVNEVIINLLYQRSQIPYPYYWLKNIVKKKRNPEDGNKNKSINFALNRHYQTVSNVYDSTEHITAEIIKAFKQYSNRIKEVIFVIGPTPVCPKEVFTVKISSVSCGHREQNHLNENGKKLTKILRSIFLENVWMNLIENPISCSTVYTFLKLNCEDEQVSENSVFHVSKRLQFSPKVKHVVIDLNYVETMPLRCCDLEIFNDLVNEHPTANVSNSADEGTRKSNHEIWLQSSLSITGFKDYFINKVSASELW